MDIQNLLALDWVTDFRRKEGWSRRGINEHSLLINPNYRKK